jgi:hypothetical protein
LAPVALRAPYAKSLNPPTPLLPCKLNPEPHTAFGPNVGTRSLLPPAVYEPRRRLGQLFQSWATMAIYLDVLY